MVLFEERDSELRYVKGGDDSGTDFNASFRVKLRKAVGISSGFDYTPTSLAVTRLCLHGRSSKYIAFRCRSYS